MFTTRSVELWSPGNYGEFQTELRLRVRLLFSKLLRPLLNCFDQTSPELARLVETSLLRAEDPPRPYNLTQSTEDILRNFPSRPDDLALEMEREYFKGQIQQGFFVEAGAASGQYSETSRPGLVELS